MVYPVSILLNAGPAEAAAPVSAQTHSALSNELEGGLLLLRMIVSFMDSLLAYTVWRTSEFDARTTPEQTGALDCTVPPGELLTL